MDATMEATTRPTRSGVLAGTIALAIAMLFDLAIVIAAEVTGSKWDLFLGNGLLVAAPSAAGLAGVLNARALRHGPGTAVFLMATTTYAIGVLLGIVLLVAESNVTLEVLAIAVFYWLLGLFVAAPLYPVCLACAWLWTVLVRRLLV